MPRLRLRRELLEQDWVSSNPTLGEGEPGFVVDTGDLKIGNGVDAWNDLPFSSSPSLSADAMLARDEAVAALEAFESQVPGTELGFAEKVNAFTTTNTNASTVTPITGLTLALVGKGRPVDIEFYAPNVYHSVANTAVGFELIVNNAILNASGQTGSVSSPQTNAGRSFYMKKRLVLVDGTNYAFGVSVYGGAAGNCSLTAAGFAQITLSATSR